MIRKTRCAAACTLAVMAAAMMMSMTAAAQDSTEVIAIPYEQEDAWKDVAMTNDDTVNTGVNIRRTADEDGEILGFLYQGNAVWIVEKGEEWTEIFTGEITGFVKNEYLVFGEDTAALAEKYGIEGVVTMWDDVKVFAKADASSEVLELLDTRDAFVLLENEGHWLKIQYGEEEDCVAYVSEDDVSPALLFETALLKEGIVPEETYEDSYDDSYDETYWEPSYDDTYYDDTYYEPSYDDSYYDDTYYEPSYPETEPSYPETEPSYPETEPSYPETEPSYPETEPSYPSTEAPSVDDGSYGGYYDADSDTYYDANGNVVSNRNETSYTEPVYEETDGYYEEPSYTETEAVSASSDDTSLLAALIYCEAGNQSYDGMVAVGAVVMNRVYSSSFPNSISEVIYQSGQFTPAYSGTLASALENGVPSTCYDAAVAAIGGENPVGSALYFNTGSGKGIKIGDHQFY